MFICVVFYVKAKHGYRNLMGIDYSPASVELARNILQAEDLTDVTVKVGSHKLYYSLHCITIFCCSGFYGLTLFCCSHSAHLFLVIFWLLQCSVLSLYCQNLTHQAKSLAQPHAVGKESDSD